MKKILSSFILAIFIIIGFFHNSMMSFSYDETLKEDTSCCIQGNNSKCAKTCCLENNIDHGASFLNNKVQKKVLKSSFLIDFNTIYVPSLYYRNNKNLIKKTSPPYVYRDVSNYSYHTLIKIIKSNT